MPISSSPTSKELQLSQNSWLCRAITLSAEGTVLAQLTQIYTKRDFVKQFYTIRRVSSIKYPHQRIFLVRFVKNFVFTFVVPKFSHWIWSWILIYFLIHDSNIQNPEIFIVIKIQRYSSLLDKAIKISAIVGNNLDHFSLSH